MKKDTRKRPTAHFKFPDEIIISYYIMTENECRWHGTAPNSYHIGCENYGWFPVDILMGTVKGYYSDTNGIGANIAGNMGTAGIAVINIDKAVEMLIAKGYTVKEKIRWKSLVSDSWY